MKNIFKYSFIALAITLCSSFFISCDDDDLGSPDRLFRPQFTETTIGGTYFSVEWDRYQGAETFELQLSVDSFKTLLRDIQVDTTEYRFNDLEYDTKYQLRIRSYGGGLYSEYFVSKDITTNDYPTKMLTPDAADMLDTRVKVKWEDVNYEYFKVLLSDTVFMTVPLTAEDNAEKEIIIAGLLPQKTYKIAAYVTEDGEEAYLGKKSYKTVASPIFDGHVVDLRNFTEEESLDMIKQSLVDSVSAEHPGEVITFALNPGTTYNINNTVIFYNDTKFVPGLSFGEKYAILAIDNNFGVQPSTTVQNISFENIFFTEGPTKKKESANFGGTYLFNFNSATDKAVVDNITFNECMIKYKRGIVRTQAEATINNIVFNECIIDSIAGYGVVNNDHAASIIKDIKVTNSTISHAEKIMVGTKAESPNSITMENVTVCYAPKGVGNYILDYNEKSIPGGIKFENCLFGTGWGSTIRGIRSAASNISINRCFKASDLEWTLNAAGDAYMYPIEELSDLGKTTTDIFEDPQNNNYTIKDKDVQDRKIGDPRWY